jgi:MFS superfamily sulfate permease-like transporter
VVVTAEPVTDVDITAADVLAELHTELTRSGVELCFAEMKGTVKDRLKRYGLFSQVGPDRFFTTVGAAVDAYLRETGVKWLDWEEAGAAGEWGEQR